jgi:hypothetical protein
MIETLRLLLRLLKLRVTLYVVWVQCWWLRRQVNRIRADNQRLRC